LWLGSVLDHFALFVDSSGANLDARGNNPAERGKLQINWGLNDQHVLHAAAHCQSESDPLWDNACNPGR
jgi:hypothetical protein